MIELELSRDIGIRVKTNKLQPRVRIAMSGISLGNCSFKTEEGRANAAKLIDHLGVRDNFAKPSLGFTNNVIPFRDCRYSFVTGYFGTPSLADGVFMDNAPTLDACEVPTFSTVFIPNADCPIAIVTGMALFQPLWCAVVCHVGLKTFDHEHTLLDKAYEAITAYMGSAPFQLGVITGFGARQCCYGLDEHTNHALFERLGKRFDLGIQTIRCGPRMGQQGVDIESLVAQNIREFDSCASIETIGICTSCFGFIDKNVHGFGTFFSNLRDERKSNSRNGLVITITQAA